VAAPPSKCFSNTSRRPPQQPRSFQRRLSSNSSPQRTGDPSGSLHAIWPLLANCSKSPRTVKRPGGQFSDGSQAFYDCPTAYAVILASFAQVSLAQIPFTGENWVKALTLLFAQPHSHRPGLFSSKVRVSPHQVPPSFGGLFKLPHTKKPPYAIPRL